MKTSPASSLHSTTTAIYDKEEDQKHLEERIKKLERLPPSAEETLSKLRKQVSFLIEEIDLKETDLAEGKTTLANYRKKFKTLHEQVIQLNEELSQAKSSWEEEKQSLESSLSLLSASKEGLEAKIEELEASYEDLSQTEKVIVEAKRRSAEFRYEWMLSRRMCEIHQKEKEFLLEELGKKSNNQLEDRKKIKRIENEFLQAKEKHFFKLEELEKRLRDSVDASVAHETSLQLALVTSKYRALLNELSLKKGENESHTLLENELQQSKEENGKIKLQLEDARQKIHSLQHSFNLLPKSSQPRCDSHVEQMARQLAALEGREDHLRRRAEHATQLFQHLQKECQELKNYVISLEKCQRDLSEANLSMQETEAKLRNQVMALVPEQVEECQQEIKTLNRDKHKLSLEVKNLEGLLEVTRTQMKHFQQECLASQMQLTQIRLKNEDLAALSQDKATIATLHFELKHEKRLNLELRDELKESEDAVSSATLERDRWKQRQEASQLLLASVTRHHQSRAQRLLLIIKDLRVQFAGAIPLPEQEQFHSLIKDLKAEKKLLAERYEAAKSDERKARLIVQEMKVKHESLEELIGGVQMTENMQCLLECSKKLEDTLLENVQLRERILCLEEEEGLFANRLENKEKRCAELQQKLSDAEKFRIDEKMQWEQIELSLLQEKAKTVEEVGVLNDSNIIPQERSRLAPSPERYLQDLKFKVDKLEMKIGRQDTPVLLLDKGVQSNIVTSPIHVIDTQKESTNVIISGLKERIQIAEETVQQYKDLLKQSRIQIDDKERYYKSQIEKLVRDKCETSTKISLLQARLDSIPTPEICNHETLVSSHLSQISSLEDAVAMLDGRLKEATRSRREAEDKLYKAERDLVIANRERTEERQQLEVSCEIKAQQLQREIDNSMKGRKILMEENDKLHEEVKSIQDMATRSPSLILRTLVEKLRDQLIEKEKQLSQMSKKVDEMKESLLQANSTSMQSLTEDVPVRDSEQGDEIEAKRLLKELETNKNNTEKLKYQITQLEVELNEKTGLLNTELEKSKVDAKSLKDTKLKLDKQLLSQKKISQDLQHQLDAFTGKSKEAICHTILTLTEKLEKLGGIDLLDKSKEHQSRVREKVMEWKEKKKMQKQIEMQKSKIEELDSELTKYQSQYIKSRQLLQSIEREKLNLQVKLNKINKSTLEGLCHICLRTLNDFGTDRPLNETFTITHDGKPPSKSQNVIAQSSSGDKSPVSDQHPSPLHDDGSGSHTANKVLVVVSPPDADENVHPDQCRLELQEKINALQAKFKSTQEAKEKAESKLVESMQEIAAMRKRVNTMQKKMEAAQKLKRPNPPPTGGERGSGALVVLDYESRISILEEELREKTRLEEHVKKVLEDAANREQRFKRERENLVQKVALLESVSDKIPNAQLITELRQAKLTVNRLQRQLEFEARKV